VGYFIDGSTPFLLSIEVPQRVRHLLFREEAIPMAKNRTRRKGQVAVHVLVVATAFAQLAATVVEILHH
jgi:hypothetical protein